MEPGKEIGMAGTITLLQQQKHNPERVSVYLDEEFAFGVTLDTAARLAKGQYLSDAEIAALRTGDEYDRAYQSALHFLGARPRSSAEVQRNLQEKEYGEDAIAAAIARLLEQGYLNDEEFARYWLENRSRFRPRSAKAIRYELRQKGVERDDIEAALEGMDEDAAAWDAAGSKLDRWRDLPEDEFERKLSGFLARRGFGFDTVRRTVQRAWKTLHAPE
jgi:regulatory protein